MDHICVIFVLYMRYHFFYIWYMYNICILCITHVCIWHKTVNEYHMFGNKMKYKYFIINKYRNTMLLSKFGFTTVQLAAEEVWLWQFVKHIFHILFFEQPLEKIRLWWCVASMARNGFAFSCRVFSQRLFFFGSLAFGMPGRLAFNKCRETVDRHVVPDDGSPASSSSKKILLC